MKFLFFRMFFALKKKWNLFSDVSFCQTLFFQRAHISLQSGIGEAAIYLVLQYK